MINKFILNSVDSLTYNYNVSHPFPHIILDNFFDEALLLKCLEEVKNNYLWTTDDTILKYQSKKYYLPDVEENDLEAYKQSIPVTKFILEYFNSPEVLNFLEKLTGIKNLIGDPAFFGGGVHKVLNEGRLSIHADFNVNRRTGLYRRINFLLYLNPIWNREWGGNLELWNKDVSKKYVSIEPIFNRVVIFNTTDSSFHGHPEPLNVPDGVCRYSLALYYYTKDSAEVNNSWRAVDWKEI